MAFTPSNVLIRVATQQVGPPLKRQKMSSTTSTTTLTNETLSPTNTRQASCSVASEDLSSMVFHVADLQRVTNFWASHHPLTRAELEMKESFKACENTANSLRDELENLQARTAANLSPAHDSTVLNDSPNDGDNDDSNISSAYELKAAETLKFFIKTSIWKVVHDEFASLAKFEGPFKDIAYDRWVRQRGSFRDAIQKAIEEDPEPLADFGEKVKRHFQCELMERTVSDLKRDLADQWKKHGNIVADS